MRGTHRRPLASRSVARFGLAVSLLCVPIAGALPPPAAAQRAVDGLPGAIHQAADQRIVAIGDIHGALDSLTQILQEVELIDEELHWIGGDTILVQTGDYTDRGPKVRETMDLLMRLQHEAPEHGGRVFVTLANHEAMNLVQFYRDTSPADFEAFVDDDSSARRDEAFEAYVEIRKRRAELLHDDEPTVDREEWEQSRPLGYVERLEAFGPNGHYGRWLRERPTAVRVDDTLFMHAGPSPELAKLGVDEINRRIWDEVELFDKTRQDMVDAELITPYADLVEIITGADGELVRFAKEYAPERGVRMSDSEQELANKLQWVLSYQKWDLLSGDGLLWFRGLAQWPEDEHLADVELILERQNVARMVAGHTTQSDGVMKTRFGGRVFIIDTGMLVEFYEGRPAALEISDGTFTAVYVGEREVLYSADSRQPATWGVAPASAMAATPAVAPDPQLPGASRVWYGPDGEPLPFDNDDDLLDFMRTAQITKIEDIGTGITRPRRLTLEENGVQLRAIFHNVVLRREQTRIDGRFFAVFRDNWSNQIAAYRLARLLEIDSVPPTVQRFLGAEEGSLQVWIENDGVMSDSERITARIYPQDLPAWMAQRWLMEVFDELIFNDDRNPGNILVDGEWRIWLIDHTRAFQSGSTLPDATRLTHIERSLWQKLNVLSDQAFRDTLSAVLAPDQINGLLRRRGALIEYFEALIDSEGVANVIYSMPGKSTGIAA